MILLAHNHDTISTQPGYYWHTAMILLSHNHDSISTQP